MEECRRVTWRVQTNVDQFRRIKKFLLWFQKKRLMVQFRCCCNFATVGHIGMQIFNFIVSSVIITHHSLLPPRISKTHFPISSLNVRELNLNWCLQDQSKKIGGLSAWGMEAQLPLQNLKIYLMNLPLFIEVYSSEWGSI